MSKKTTLAYRQKRNILITAALIALLIVGALVANYLVSLGEFVDTDGTKYTIKQEDGVFGLYDKNGYRLDTTVEDNKTFFVTDLGTLVSLSGEGKASIYAVVDTDDGEDLSDYQRILIFPKVETNQIQSLRVVNESGTYTFVRNENGKMVIKGYEDVMLYQSSSEVDYTKSYSYLAGLCSALYVMDGGKYPASTVAKYGLEEYGLDEPSASYTISTTTGKSYTVLVGDPIVSGNGYYVKLADRDTVYIINSYYSLLFANPENYVAPLLQYGMTSTNYPEVYNFNVFSVFYDEEGNETTRQDVGATYWPLPERQGTEYESQVYTFTDEKMSGYIPHTSAITAAMLGIANPTSATVAKLGKNEGALAEYGLDKPIKLVYFENKLTEGNTTYTFRNYISISAITERRTHYVTTTIEMSENGKDFYTLQGYDMILEVDHSHLAFVDYKEIDWFERYYFHRNIMQIESFEFVTPENTYLLSFEADENDITRITATVDGKSINVDVDEFKILYRSLLYGNLYDATGLSDEEHKAITDKAENFQFSYRVKTKANKLDITYSFYKLSETKSYIKIGDYGNFFVLSSFVEKYASDIVDLINGLPLTPLSQY